MWTLSSLQLHPHPLVVCDDDATLELRVKTVKASLPRPQLCPTPAYTAPVLQEHRKGGHRARVSPDAATQTRLGRRRRSQRFRVPGQRVQASCAADRRLALGQPAAGTHERAPFRRRGQRPGDGGPGRAAIDVHARTCCLTSLGRWAGCARKVVFHDRCDTHGGFFSNLLGSIAMGVGAREQIIDRLKLCAR